MVEQNPIPFTWFQNHFINDLLPYWQKSATDPNGFFYPNFDRKWQRIGNPVATLVSQSRLLYVFSNGFFVTGDKSLRNIVDSGARFLLNHFLDEDFGGFVWACNEKGEVTDYTKDAYGHAFVLLGLSMAFRTTGKIIFLKAAVKTYEVICARFRDPNGSLIWKKTRDWKELEKSRSQNPMMHAFEAFLVLNEILTSGGNSVIKKWNILAKKVKKDILEIAGFLFFPAGSRKHPWLDELYTKGWQPLPASKGGHWSVGHQFEWAYLLSMAVNQGLPEKYLRVADDCLESALSHGFNVEKGYIYSCLDDKGMILDKSISWWEQSEGLRTLMHFIVCYDRTDLIKPYHSLFSFVKNSFLDPVYGGWFTSLQPDGTPLQKDKGSSWKLDYHQTGLCLEAIRLSKETFL